jgi:hypothetical protein
MGAVIAALLIASWSLLVSGSASADTADPGSGASHVAAGANVVSLDLATCEASVRRDALLAQLRIELTALGFVLTMLDEPHALTVRLTFSDCERQPDAIEIAVRSESEAVSRRSNADMADTRLEDRPRALALSIAELIRRSDFMLPPHEDLADADAGDASHVGAETPVSPASKPASSPDPVIFARDAHEDLAGERARRWRAVGPVPPLIVRATGVMRKLKNDPQWLSGASIQVGIAALPYLEVALALEALAGRNNTNFGRYRVMTLLSETSLDLVWGKRLALRAGPRLLLGQALARGISDQVNVVSSTTRDLSVGIGAAAGAHAGLSDRVSLVAYFAAGTFLRGLTIRVEDEARASTEGPWLEAALGVAFVL